MLQHLSPIIQIMHNFHLEERIFKFNETCCEAKGVPEGCMDLCREEVEDTRKMAARSVDVLPVSKCEKHKDDVTSCIYQYGKIYLHSKNLSQ